MRKAKPVLAWGYKNSRGRILSEAYPFRREAHYYFGDERGIVLVEIREVKRGKRRTKNE